MNVTPQQQQALITFLSRRLPDWDQRSKVAQGAVLPEAQFAGDPRTGWSTLIVEAIDKGRLPQLLRAAANVAPGDAELAQLADEASRGELVVPFNLPDRRLLVAGLAVAAVLALGGLVMIGGSMFIGSGSGEAVDPDPVEPIASTDAVGVTPDVEPPSAPAERVGEGDAEEAQPPEAPVEPATPPPVEVTPLPPVAKPPVQEPVAPAKPKTPPTASVTSAGPNCGTPAGKVVGYAFYAMDRPEFAGGVWQLTRDLNVRQQYPSKENHWSTDSPVVCVLVNGSRLNVKAEPVRVAGGAWWIPVVGGEATPPQ